MTRYRVWDRVMTEIMQQIEVQQKQLKLSYDPKKIPRTL